MNRRLIVTLAVVVAATVPAGAAVLRLGSADRLPPADGPDRAAAVPGTPHCGGRPLVAERQLRGMWLTTVNNIDWPSRPGLPRRRSRRSTSRGWTSRSGWAQRGVRARAAER